MTAAGGCVVESLQQQFVCYYRVVVGHYMHVASRRGCQRLCHFRGRWCGRLCVCVCWYLCCLCLSRWVRTWGCSGHHRRPATTMMTLLCQHSLWILWTSTFPKTRPNPRLNSNLSRKAGERPSFEAHQSLRSLCRSRSLYIGAVAGNRKMWQHNWYVVG